ncbi:transcriptional regulator [Marmoricola endophyticus]|uniref:Transcriptional regulator n=1 Tax=Marmoricola endophyticus TaxID=2040280 RepID=A0A917F712_9ACTN|nr:helix-turn-helix domain-containing protein [Marmoricola endophyticus]GGF53727.1 transcriptional regulator [Marmoricola endophyticus]
MDTGTLHELRGDAVRAWTTFVEHGEGALDDVSPARRTAIRPEILSSWRRSAPAIDLGVSGAPLDDEQDTAAYWRESALQVAVSRIEDELRRTAEDGDLVLAVTDPQTRILWTYGGRVMRTKAETVNFVPGGRWDDTSVGTNALDLAGRMDTPSMVFSAEHYAPIVHNWVCWAAPVHDPATGERLGVIDLSTTWDRTHPIGLATARMMARLIETAIPDRAAPPRPRGAAGSPVEVAGLGLSLTLLGSAEARLDGRRLLLNRRQTEILALLAMHPDGLSLDQLHAYLYGDQAVTASTLKAEVSHLRAALGGALASRPYRLMMPVEVDVDSVIAHIRSGDVLGAVAAYGGDLLPGTNSPVLSELADYVAVALREALLADPQPDAVMGYSEIAPYDTEVLEHCLAGLGAAPHPARALLRGRLAAAAR